MRKLAILTLTLFLAFVLTACGGGNEGSEGENQLPNPWIDCGTLEDAAELAGFNIAVPDRIEGYPDILIQAVENDMIQVFYSDKPLENEDAASVLIRKGRGYDEVSGDYNSYSIVENETLHGVDVTLKGDGEAVYLAVWTQDEYAYCISADKGLSKEQIEDLVELVK